MGFVIELLSDRRLNLAVQIGSRLTRYDTHTTTHSSHTGSRLGWDSSRTTIHSHSQRHGMVRPRGEENRRRDRDGTRLAAPECWLRLPKKASGGGQTANTSKRRIREGQEEESPDRESSAELEPAVLDRPLPFLFGPGGGLRRVRTYCCVPPIHPFPLLCIPLHSAASPGAGPARGGTLKSGAV